MYKYTLLKTVPENIFITSPPPIDLPGMFYYYRHLVINIYFLYLKTNVSGSLSLNEIPNPTVEGIFKTTTER